MKTFSLIQYNKPFFSIQDTEIEDFIGIDSESYKNGKPFLICSSDGETFDIKKSPFCFARKKYDGRDFCCYNLKYDSGSILHALPLPVLRELWIYGDVEFNGFKLFYIPHKFLSIKKGKREYRFWDILQFYNCSLDTAARRYLNKSKIEIGTKSFTPSYVKKHYAKIKEYCINDCVLLKDLAFYFKKKLNEFGVKVSRLYSSASISFDYIQEHARIITIWDLWNNNPKALEYAHNSYSGGKFEVTQRGSFHGFEYDITSAYPYEIANLIDITGARVIFRKGCSSLIENAHYAFLRCKVKIENPVFVPFGVMVDNVRMYPIGYYDIYITKNEYLYIKDKIDIEVVDGYYFLCKKISHPYRSVIHDLFFIKDEYKHKDKMLYNITKIMMNGFYGKMCQLILDNRKGVLKAGSAWNPIYASVITANTRIRVTEMQEKFGDHCVGVHTDSIITNKPLDKKLLGEGLGAWHFELTGPACVIACGMYEIGDKNAYRGYEFHREFSWKKLLKKNPKSKIITYNQVRSVSWTQAQSWNKMDKMNLFEDFQKDIHLNSDVKRVWFNETNGERLLHGLETSAPKIIP